MHIPQSQTVHAERLQNNSNRHPRTAIIIPCFNEELTISKVVNDFRVALPPADIYVYDNNSTDQTAEAARAAGAIVRSEPLRGKGNVVRRMFADVEADIYVLVDGDDTYHAPSASILVDTLLDSNLDMVIALRESTCEAAYRPGHRFGNRLVTGTVRTLFGDRFRDILSGYRVLSRRFVKSFPALAAGFEIETELTIHALELRMPTAEIQTPYKERPAGSASKLRTFHDGFRILSAIIALVKRERPLTLFGSLCLVLVSAALILGAPLVETYLQTGLVPRLPTAVLVTGLVLLGFLSLGCGLILDTVTLGRKEMKRMSYLRFPASGRCDR